MKKISEFNLNNNNGSGIETTVGTDYLTCYAYDNFNRLTNSSSKGSNILYQYNSEDYRIQKSVNGDRIRYLYEADKVVLELNDNGEEIGRNVYGTNLIYREALSENNTEAYYYLYNAHGDVTGLLKQNGTIAATYCYDAFGNLLSKQGQVNNTVTYAGYQYDAETELYYLNARYYDSKIARFLTEDTYGGEYNDPLSLNRYTYCANNPIIYIDPSGRIWQKTDKDLNDDAQAKIISLTTAEIHAKTKEEKKELQKQQESIRNSSSSIKGVDTVIEINNKNQDAFIKDVNKALANGSISQTEWKKCLKSLGATYDFEKTYDKNKNGNTVSTINCTTNVNKNVEINVTVNSAKNNKNTNIVSSSSNITVTTHYSAYVYYLPE